MATRTKQQAAEIRIRRVAAQDLDAVVALDESVIGRSRRFYFERRLKAALAQPELHLQFAAERGGKLAGFMMARKQLGMVDPPADGQRRVQVPDARSVEPPRPLEAGVMPVPGAVRKPR